MARKPRDELERAIQDALAPGAFIGYRHSWDFLKDVEAVRGEIVPLIRNREAPRPVALLETFLAGCYEKSEEIDDSDGNFGQFVEQLFCDWIRARQAANAEPDETVGTLLSWMDDDDYGYCHRLEEEVVDAFNKAGLAAFERAVRSRMAGQERSAYPYRRSVEILKAVFTKRRDAQGYADLCEAENDLAPEDCETLAELSLKRGRNEDALAWAERGLALEAKNRWPNRAAWRLPKLRRTILKRLGRTGDALAAEWRSSSGTKLTGLSPWSSFPTARNRFTFDPGPTRGPKHYGESTCVRCSHDRYRDGRAGVYATNSRTAPWSRSPGRRRSAGRRQSWSSLRRWRESCGPARPARRAGWPTGQFR